ncbi:LysR family transcriptional regulator [Gammaproteobacteria bacterium 45_16_T64]|nr:LysR family transcriptional regulator [Gammaproteobacteria bacterium 45_16_T64]
MAKTDLNLIVIFDAIMKEHSITAAAERLAMTQPSVSNAVSRMRHAWKDPLFVKDGRGVRPTPYALKLWQDVAQSLNCISEAVAPSEFDPSESSARFRIALTDGTLSLVWPELRKIIEQEAPGVDIHAVPYKADGEPLLLNADVDMVFDYYPGTCDQIRTQGMFDNHFVCVMNVDHPLAEKNLSLKRFVNAEHVLVSLSGDASGIVDSELAALGMSRRIAVTVNSFGSAVNLVKQSQLISAMPYPIVAQCHAAKALVVKPLPVVVPPARITMAWHCRDDRSPRVGWLRRTMERIVHDKRALFDRKITT